MDNISDEIQYIFKKAKKRSYEGGTNFKDPLQDSVINRFINREDRKKLIKFRKNNVIISLLCPSRERPTNIVKLLDNIYNTISNPIAVETLFKLDKDDTISINTLKQHFNKIFYIRLMVKERTDKLNNDYYNFLAKRAYGKYLFSIGDDVVFHTKDWNIILASKIEAYLKDKPDRIAYISVTERGSQAKHPCFPIITKEAFNKLGMYFHPQLLSWGADRCLYEVYSGINRILHIPEIEIEHISYHDKKAPFDKTAQSMKERFFKNPNCHNLVSITEVPSQIQYLQDYIKEYNDSRME